MSGYSKAPALAALAVAALLLPLPPASAATHEVDVGDNDYSPTEIEIEVGDTVRWTHVGDGNHSVTAEDESFDSHPDCPADCMQNGDTFVHTFEDSGSYEYYCRIHGVNGGAMRGTVTVQGEEEDGGAGPAADEGDEDSPAASRRLPRTGTAAAWPAGAALLAGSLALSRAIRASRGARRRRR